MIVKRYSKNKIIRAIFGCLFGIMMILSGVLTTPVYADPVGEEITEVVETEEVTEENVEGEDTEEEGVYENAETEENEEVEGENQNKRPQSTCERSLESIGWLVCPTTGKVAEAVDWLYEKIEKVLVINPVEMKDGSPIYEVWKYIKGITNIIFIIFLLVVIYSQITGVGISNYGVKKALPKLIVAAILVNLSFVLCSLAVDVSNVVGQSLRGVFTSIEESTIGTMTFEEGQGMYVSMSQTYSALAGGSVLAVGAGVIAFETGAIWMLIPVVLGAIVAVVTGLITIALRQAVVALLIMIAPMAIVAYILPNTEEWFKKWKKLLIRMLVFYPMFSLLFGASSLAGFAIIASATDGFWVLVGIAVQIFPLFFSWSLMKMSGTVLGTINTKLRGLATRPLASTRSWAESRKAQTSAYHMQYGVTPSAYLRRYLDNRKALRDTNTANLQSLRKNEASIYVQKKIASGYDGTTTQDTKGDLKSNRYTRVAKDLSNSNLAAEMTAMDTKHVINEYGSYFVPKHLRVENQPKGISAEELAKLERARKSNPDFARAAIGANNFLEYSRAKMTTENDAESDFNFMVDEFLDASIKFRPDEANDQFSKYKHYIMSSAGGLGKKGQTRVLGKIVAQAAAVESSQRRDINIVANKFPPNKSNFRNMLVGYYVDDDGYAVDKNGNQIESVRGWLLQNDPDKLVLWDQVDGDNGPYFDWYDTNGNYVTRIYKKDKSAIKELLSSFDAPINDPINNLYGILAGIKQGDIKSRETDEALLKLKENLKYIGLDSYRTTVGRAILNAPFKEKNAAFSPMVAEMVNKGYIKNYATEYLAYLDSLNKSTKPGPFNVQDGDAIEMFTRIMDPDNWDEIFAKELVKDFKNVNGKPLVGIRVDEEGNETEVPIEEATQEELMRKIKRKFIYPAARKMVVMMSRQTQNTSDNQKAGTIEKWKALKDVFDDKWGEGSGLEDPYKQAGDMRSMAWEIQDQLYMIDDDGNKVSVRDQRRRNSMDGGRQWQHVGPSAHHEAVDSMYIRSGNDIDEFARNFAEYCDGYPELANANRDFRNYILDMEARGVRLTVEDLRDMADSLIDSYATD